MSWRRAVAAALRDAPAFCHLRGILILAVLAAFWGGCNAQPVQPPKHLLPQASDEGWVFKHILWGYVDTTSNFVIPPQFDDAKPFHEDLAQVLAGGKWGWIDNTGQFVIPAKFEMALEFSDGLALVCQDGLWGMIDKTGKYVIPNIYDRLWAFQGGLAAFSKDGLWGFLDTSGAEAIPAQFEYVSAFTKGSGWASVKIGGKWGAIDKSGRLVIQPQFDERFAFDDDLARVCWKRVLPREDSPWGPPTEVREFGFVNRQDQVLPGRYIDAGDFREGLAPVCFEGKWVGQSRGMELKGAQWGYIDATGAMVIAPQFDSANEFKDGKAAVRLNGKTFFIDKQGTRLEEKPGAVTPKPSP